MPKMKKPIGGCPPFGKSDVAFIITVLCILAITALSWKALV